MKKLTFVLGLLFLAQSANALPINSLSNLGFGLDGGFAMPDAFTPDYNFEGIVALSNCSGSIVRFEDSAVAELAMILTNGHCLEGGFMKPGQVAVAKKSSRTFSVLDKAAKALGRVSASEIIYGTMTKTDMSLYQLTKTYAEIEAAYSVKPLTLQSQRAKSEIPLEVISGYWKRGYSCNHAGTVHKIKEADWTWEDSIRYSQPGCEIIGGTSGSPVLQGGTRNVVGVNNTTNENGQECTMNNPCEVDADGKVTYKKGLGYAQQIDLIYGCIGADHKLDLTLETCQLPKPQ